MNFIKRTTAPSRDDAHYYADNIFYQSDYGLPNCTCYCWGRWYELLNEKPKLCINNARDWYWHNDGYQRSQNPKVGAVACYDDGKCGHVAIVEELYDDGTMLISESDYLTPILFRTRRIGQHADAYEGYRLQGFIILPISFEDEKPVEPTPNKSIDEIAQEVINGDWGNGEERKNALINAGYDYNAVQNRVNEIMNNPAPNKKSNEEIARAVINGDYGNGEERAIKLMAEGYDPVVIQDIVNSMM